MRQVPDEEVITAHRGTKLSVEEVGYLGVSTNMFQFVDIFSIPEITLFRDAVQVRQHKITNTIMRGNFFVVFCR